MAAGWSGRVQFFETSGDLPVTVYGHQMHAVEGAAIADLHDLLACRVDPRHLVGGDLVRKPLGDLDVGNGCREPATHGRAGQDHDTGVDRGINRVGLTPAQQGLYGEADLHEYEVRSLFPLRQGPQPSGNAYLPPRHSPPTGHLHPPPPHFTLPPDTPPHSPSPHT